MTENLLQTPEREKRNIVSAIETHETNVSHLEQDFRGGCVALDGLHDLFLGEGRNDGSLDMVRNKTSEEDYDRAVRLAQEGMENTKGGLVALEEEQQQLENKLNQETTAAEATDNTTLVQELREGKATLERAADKINLIKEDMDDVAAKTRDLKPILKGKQKPEKEVPLEYQNQTFTGTAAIETGSVPTGIEARTGRLKSAADALIDGLETNIDQFEDLVGTALGRGDVSVTDSNYVDQNEYRNVSQQILVLNQRRKAMQTEADRLRIDAKNVFHGEITPIISELSLANNKELETDLNKALSRIVTEFGGSKIAAIAELQAVDKEGLELEIRQMPNTEDARILLNLRGQLVARLEAIETLINENPDDKEALIDRLITLQTESARIVREIRQMQRSLANTDSLRGIAGELYTVGEDLAGANNYSDNPDTHTSLIGEIIHNLQMGQTLDSQMGPFLEYMEQIRQDQANVEEQLRERIESGTVADATARAESTAVQIEDRRPQRPERRSAIDLGPIEIYWPEDESNPHYRFREILRTFGFPRRVESFTFLEINSTIDDLMKGENIDLMEDVIAELQDIIYDATNDLQDDLARVADDEERQSRLIQGYGSLISSCNRRIDNLQRRIAQVQGKETRAKADLLPGVELDLDPKVRNRIMRPIQDARRAIQDAHLLYGSFLHSGERMEQDDIEYVTATQMELGQNIILLYDLETFISSLEATQFYQVRDEVADLLDQLREASFNLSDLMRGQDPLMDRGFDYFLSPEVQNVTTSSERINAFLENLDAFDMIQIDNEYRLAALIADANEMIDFSHRALNSYQERERQLLANGEPSRYAADLDELQDTLSGLISRRDELQQAYDALQHEGVVGENANDVISQHLVTNIDGVINEVQDFLQRYPDVTAFGPDESLEGYVNHARSLYEEAAFGLIILSDHRELLLANNNLTEAQRDRINTNVDSLEQQLSDELRHLDMWAVAITGREFDIEVKVADLAVNFAIYRIDLFLEETDPANLDADALQERLSLLNQILSESELVLQREIAAHGEDQNVMDLRQQIERGNERRALLMRRLNALENLDATPEDLIELQAEESGRPRRGLRVARLLRNTRRAFGSVGKLLAWDLLLGAEQKNKSRAQETVTELFDFADFNKLKNERRFRTLMELFYNRNTGRRLEGRGVSEEERNEFVAFLYFLSEHLQGNVFRVDTNRFPLNRESRNMVGELNRSYGQLHVGTPINLENMIGYFGREFLNDLRNGFGETGPAAVPLTAAPGEPPVIAPPAPAVVPAPIPGPAEATAPAPVEPVTQAPQRTEAMPAPAEPAAEPVVPEVPELTAHYADVQDAIDALDLDALAADISEPSEGDEAI